PPSPPNENNLDDIFSSSRSPSPTLNPHEENRSRDLSDIPRLRQVHTTAGYRDGVTMAKTQFIQEGFDEGFQLGAEVGQRVGWLLGLLEGMATGLNAATLKERFEEVIALWAQARQELEMENVFGKEYFGEGGGWMYELEGVEEEHVTFRDVAERHPAVARWKGVVEELAARWGI
ncbi:hypothetical protein K402DRAFT_313371, partial [Aulographum hederae CBS 113979]